MEINGLPLHALVIHGAVVFGPLAALLAFGYAVPALRERLRAPLLVTAVLAGVFVLLAYLSGNQLLDDNPGLAQLPGLDTHEDRAIWALVATLVFAVIAVAATTLHRRAGAVRAVLSGLLVLGAAATLVSVIAVGDAGAKLVWGV